MAARGLHVRLHVWAGGISLERVTGLRRCEACSFQPLAPLATTAAPPYARASPEGQRATNREQVHGRCSVWETNPA